MKVKSLVAALLVAGLSYVSFAHAADDVLSKSSVNTVSQVELASKFTYEEAKAFEQYTGINQEFGRKMCESAGLQFNLLYSKSNGTKLICGNISKEGACLGMNLNVTKVVGNLISMQITFEEYKVDKETLNTRDLVKSAGVAFVDIDKVTGYYALSRPVLKLKSKNDGFVSEILQAQTVD